MKVPAVVAVTMISTLGMRYKSGLTHLEIGQRLGNGIPQERDHLEQAEAIFTELKVELDLAGSRKLLQNL